MTFPPGEYTFTLSGDKPSFSQSNKTPAELTELSIKQAIELMLRKSPPEIVQSWRCGVYVRGSVDPDLRLVPWPWGESWRRADMMEGEAREFALVVLADQVEERLLSRLNVQERSLRTHYGTTSFQAKCSPDQSDPLG